MTRNALYLRTSFTKIILGCTTLGLDFWLINIKEDTTVALTLGLIGGFLIVWGVSYFLFTGIQWLFSSNISFEQIQKNAYKSSFLFGLFTLINLLLIIMDLRSKWIGLCCLGIFIAMRYLIFTDSSKERHAEPSI